MASALVTQQFGSPAHNPGMSDKPPTEEMGAMTQWAPGVPGWQQYVGDDLERAPQLMWPQSVMTYSQMRHDGQIQGLYLGTTLPLRRYLWQIDPNGCDPKLVDQLSADLNLPIKGKDPEPRKRSRGRFNFKKHLEDALLALLFGHYAFEQVGVIEEDKLWHLRKLAPRPPETINAIHIDPSGDLMGFTQYYSQQVGGTPLPIPVSRVVWYSWMMEGANWPGRSMLRACYRNWLRKDRLLRVDAQKQERNGMGIPIAEGPPGASGPALARLDIMMRNLRAGDMSGGAIPAGSKVALVGTTGTLPDTLASIRLDNEEMARAWLAMFMQLGTTETGSRALGSEFIDFFADAIDEMATWFCDSFTEQVIEDWWDWNVNPDADTTPLLVKTRNPDSAFVARDFAHLVQYGAITVDETLENSIRERMGLPPRDEADAPPKLPAPPGSIPWPPPEGTIDPATGQLALPAAGETGNGNTHASLPGSPTPPPATNRRERAVTAAGLGSPVSLPNRPLRRQPYEHEIAASVDWASMDTSWQTKRDALVATVRANQVRQIDELHDQIVEAGNDLDKLSSIAATPNMEEHIQAAMAEIAIQGARDAQAEAMRQGSAVTLPDLEELTDGQVSRAQAIDKILASSITSSARTTALRYAGGSLSGADIANAVSSKLNGLSGSFLRDRMGGAMTAAMNSGRRATIDNGSPTQIYASELMDDHTCEACIGEDGTQFSNMSDAEADYPGGGFVDCFGGDRCRGTLIAVYNESVATIE